MYGPSGTRVGAVFAVALCALLVSCEPGSEISRDEALLRATPRQAPAPSLSDTAFARLSATLSGPGGYFDTDNLISNEASYLHVLGALEDLAVRGGVYIGVGPDQNFSYIADVRPRMAFIVDIRRDNMLQHLLFKALFEVAPTRVEYLAHLVGRPTPEDRDAWRDRSVEDIVDWIDGAPADPGAANRARALVDSAVATFGIPLDPAERSTIRRFHDTFIDAGLDLRFSSHGRAPRPYYPTLRRLVLERDLEGRRRSYLATPGAYERVREMQLRNLIVPVVGDLAGEHALRAIGRELASRDEAVTCLYTSNVEFYLFRSGSFDRFVENLRTLPLARGAVLIRSHFPGPSRSHPHRVPEYWSTQSLQTVASLLEAEEEGGYRSYLDLVTRHAIDPRPAGAGGAP